MTRAGKPQQLGCRLNISLSLVASIVDWFWGIVCILSSTVSFSNQRLSLKVQGFTVVTKIEQLLAKRNSNPINPDKANHSSEKTVSNKEP